MSLSELAARLDLAPSTTHGIVRTLVEHGMVVQERGSSRYQLGPAVLRLGNVYLDTLELRSKAVPWAEDLARRTGMAVRTGVLLIDDVVIIHHEPRPDGSRQMPEVGIVIPAHASALGKAMLAFAAQDADRMLSAGGLRSMTGETLTDPEQIRDQLDQIRVTGIAREQDEAVLGEGAGASPVFDSWGSVVGAIGVVISGASEADPGDLVRETARSLSRELGASSWPPPQTRVGRLPPGRSSRPLVGRAAPRRSSRPSSVEPPLVGRAASRRSSSSRPPCGGAGGGWMRDGRQRALLNHRLSLRSSPSSVEL